MTTRRRPKKAASTATRINPDEMTVEELREHAAAKFYSIPSGKWAPWSDLDARQRRIGMRWVMKHAATSALGCLKRVVLDPGWESSVLGLRSSEIQEEMKNTFLGPRWGEMLAASAGPAMRYLIARQLVRVTSHNGELYYLPILGADDEAHLEPAYRIAWSEKVNSYLLNDRPVSLPQTILERLRDAEQNGGGVKLHEWERGSVKKALADARRVFEAAGLPRSYARGMLSTKGGFLLFERDSRAVDNPELWSLLRDSQESDDVAL